MAKKKVKKIIKNYKNTLVGFAHYDNGKKVKGCKCCYCREERSNG